MSEQVNATAIREGVLKTNNDSASLINIRSGPSLNNKVIRQGKKGDVVTVIEETQPSGEKYTWYKIRFGSAQNDIGWVRNDVIEVTYKNPSDASTRLRFATQSKTVRIYQGDEEVYINVYDNKAEETELLQVPIAKIPKLDTETKWQGYMTFQGKLVYYVRFIPFGEVSLVTSNKDDGKIIRQEKGFQASGSEYRGA
ncbi:MAG: SH3 domain-containing protein [Cyanobacteria bacterium P01_A01_bin.84]